MFNVCYYCGLYRPDKIIDPTGPYAICPECDGRHLFRQLPLFLVGGASGTGKSTICQHLVGKVTEAVLLDADILWRSEFNTPENNYNEFFETWLRLAKNIGQSGRPVVIFNAGFAVPANVESCIERRYFSNIHYLALVCDDGVLKERLLARPSWRDSGQSEFLAGQFQFNHWLKEQGPKEGISLLDTTAVAIPQSAQTVIEWLYSVP